MQVWDESAYRKQVDDLFRHIDSAFEEVDPDLAESDFSQGTLVITFRQAAKLILSPQAPLRQIWVAFRDQAWHFNLSSLAIPDGSSTGRWLHDRDQGVELLGLLAILARDNAGIEIHF